MRNAKNRNIKSMVNDRTISAVGDISNTTYDPDIRTVRDIKNISSTRSIQKSRNSNYVRDIPDCWVTEFKTT